MRSQLKKYMKKYHLRLASSTIAIATVNDEKIFVLYYLLYVAMFFLVTQDLMAMIQAKLPSGQIVNTPYAALVQRLGKHTAPSEPAKEPTADKYAALNHSRYCSVRLQLSAQ